jgi:hypothetical protein
MAGPFVIRRLRLVGLAPRDHPSPADLEQRLKDTAHRFLPEALEQAVGLWSGDAVLRIRRLLIDITLDAAFEPKTFASSLAQAIIRQLRRVEASGTVHGGSDGVVCYASRAIYVAALVEALAEGRAAQCWWLRDAEGLRFLSMGAAIRTALLADARAGLEALASLPPSRRMAVLRTLTRGETERLLDGLSKAEAGAAGFEDCAAAVAGAAAELPAGASALAVFLGAFVRRPGLAGPALAATARLWVEMEHVLRNRAEVGAIPAPVSELEPSTSVVRSLLQSAAAVPGAAGTVPEDARLILAAAASGRDGHSAEPGPVHRFTPFGGLLLLLPTLGMTEIADVAAGWSDAPPDVAALIGYAALGLCAGRERFAAWLGDDLWRELFGFEGRLPAATLVERIAEISNTHWETLLPSAAALNNRRDASFLLPPRRLAGSRAGAHALAGLARAASARFARRLAGFAGVSAEFLWENLLGSGAALWRWGDEWEARLTRPPLDVLLSLSRIAEGSASFPSGIRVRIARVAA